MGGYWLNVALICALVLINALFAGSEIALISVREGQVRQLERRGFAGARTLARLARDPNRFLATIQIGITLAGFLASATAAVSLARPLTPRLGFLGGAAEAVAIALVTLVLTFATLVFGELAPKRLAMQHAQRWALLVGRPLNALATVCRPAVWVLSKATDVTVRVFGGNPEMLREQLSSEELRDLVIGQRGLDREQRRMVIGAMELHERTLREVLVPRRAVFTIPADAPIAAAQAMLAASGHSRAPVLASSRLEDVVGVVHLRDLLTEEGTVTEVARPAVLFPDTLRISEALRRFKTDRQQFALVVDERSAVSGIVTLEDLLEEIVGEIYDETDRDVMEAQRFSDGSLLLPGSFPVHDLPDLGVEIIDAPRGAYTTIAGLVLAALGRIPDRPGDQVELADWTIEVISVAHHTITSVHLHPRGEAGGGE
ncbi:hemolysin family protein [Actinoallomurus acaciae]|uniref:Hemolysin family protein n=1 Tax=Actinoallomurus acaciae TaxID=502577 RepID=A0ABV5YQ36_9ACTN